MTSTTPTKRILICDDDPEIVDIVTLILRGSGYLVDSAANHSEFFTKYGEFQPDLIILDIAMPEHDGFWIADKLQALENRAAVIFVSAYSKPTYRLCAPLAGAIDYVLKPFEPSVLLERVANALRPGAVSSNWFLSATCSSQRLSE